MAAATLLWVYACASSAWQVDRPPVNKVEQATREGTAIVGFEWVDAPLNRIMLVRTPDSMCAVKFTRAWRVGKIPPGSEPDRHEEVYFTDYEIAQLERTSGTASGGFRAMQLSNRGMRGIGRLAIRLGTRQIPCGKRDLEWLYPTAVLMMADRPGVELAPTNWESLGQIDLANPKLVWYQNDPRLSRALVFVPADDLAAGGR